MNFGNIDLYNFNDATYVKLNGRVFQLSGYGEEQYNMTLEFSLINEHILIGQLSESAGIISGKDEFLEWICKEKD